MSLKKRPWPQLFKVMISQTVRFISSHNLLDRKKFCHSIAAPAASSLCGAPLSGLHTNHPTNIRRVMRFWGSLFWHWFDAAASTSTLYPPCTCCRSAICSFASQFQWYGHLRTGNPMGTRLDALSLEQNDAMRHEDKNSGSIASVDATCLFCTCGSTCWRRLLDLSIVSARLLIHTFIYHDIIYKQETICTFCLLEYPCCILPQETCISVSCSRFLKKHIGISR